MCLSMSRQYEIFNFDVATSYSLYSPRIELFAKHGSPASLSDI
jgi:hypothetical protein